MIRDLAELRLKNLRDTWIRSRELSPYYADLLPRLPESDIHFDTLQNVPKCTKEIFQREHQRMRIRRGLPPFMVFTGGSSGLPRIIYGTDEIASAGGQKAPLRADAGPLPLTLFTGGGHHGEVPGSSSGNGCIHIPLRSRANYQWAWNLLSAEHSFQGYETKISGIFLPLPAVKKLVHFLLEQNCDLSLLQLRWVGTYAWYLSSSWRQLISKVLNARVIDYFGFTEALGVVAQQCDACGYYHYGENAISEIVEPKSSGNEHTTLGSLLLTTVSVDSHDHILFRYESGDLVERGPFCDVIGESGFRPCGPLSQSAFLLVEGRHCCVLKPSDVAELIDMEPLVARTGDPRFSGITQTSDDTFPKWRAMLDQGSGHVPVLKIEVEVRMSPSLFYEAAQQLRMKWRTKLLSTNRDLRESMAGDRIQFQIDTVCPGTIPEDEVFIL